MRRLSANISSPRWIDSQALIELASARARREAYFRKALDSKSNLDSNSCRRLAWFVVVAVMMIVMVV